VVYIVNIEPFALQRGAVDGSPRIPGLPPEIAEDTKTVIRAPGDLSEGDSEF
jgi:hypothetical protein